MNALSICPIASSFVSSPISNPNPVGAFDTAWIAITLLAMLLLVVILVCCWLVWRMRTLVRVIIKLRTDSSRGVAVPGPFGFLPTFRVRTLLVVFTLVAVLFGLFASELFRARKQARALERLDLTGAFDVYGGTYYRLGMLGDSRLATFACEWIHPHFGCRLTHLAIDDDLLGEEPAGLRTDELAAIEHLSDLEALQIQHRIISAEELQAIVELPRLKKLSLDDCRLPIGAGKSLGKMNRLEELNLNNCRLVDADLDGIGNLNSLRVLLLDFNDITDASTDELNKLVNLQELRLNGTEIKDAGLMALLSLEKLTDLQLAGTPVTDSGVMHLTELPELQFVTLAGCHGIRVDKRPEIEQAFASTSSARIDWRSMPEPEAPWKLWDNRPSYSPQSPGFSAPFNGGGGQF